MKLNKFLWSLGILAALGLASCSSDNPAEEPSNPSEISDGTPRYMAVTIRSVGDNSRAEGGQTSGDPGATYEEGYSAENTITSVRFYFYSDEEGTNPVNVQSITNSAEPGTFAKNYLDVTALGSSSADMPNVEKKYDAVLIFNVTSGTTLPSYVVAVANITSLPAGDAKNLLSTGTGTDDMVTLANIQSVIENCNATTNPLMASAVYYDGSKIKIASSTTIFNTQTSAENNPVDIYLERSISKVRVKNGLPTADKIDGITVTGIGDNVTLYPLNAQKVGTTDIYVAFAGWQVTNDAAKSYLVKQIETTWTDDNLGFTWNYAPYHRCFWAKNPNFGTITGVNLYNGLNHYSWDDASASTSAFYASGNSNVRYCQENADEGASKSTKRYTQVLVKGILCDNTGNPLTIGVWLGERYNSEEALKNAILSNLNSSESLNYWRLKVSGDAGYDPGTPSYTQITQEHLKFMTVSAAGNANNSATDLEVYGDAGSTYKLDPSTRYNVCLTLTTDAGLGTNVTWYKKSGETMTEITTADIKAAFAKLTARIYKGGMTYYYFDIKHLGSSGKIGEYGIVRNHIYDCTAKTVSGLGTPVYDPDEVIIPETIEEERSFMAARINVLSWRVVTNNYGLGN